MVFLNDIGTFTQFGRFPIIDNLQLAWPPYGTFYTEINIDIFLPIFIPMRWFLVSFTLAVVALVVVVRGVQTTPFQFLARQSLNLYLALAFYAV